MKRFRYIILTITLTMLILSPSYAMKYDWTDEFFRMGISATGLSISAVDFYEGHNTSGAKTFYMLPLTFTAEVMGRFSITPFLSIGTDIGVIFESHNSRNFKLGTSLFIYRLYPSVALEFHTKSAYFTNNYRLTRKETPSMRFEFSLLAGLSPGFFAGNTSAVPFLGIKPAGVLSVNNVDLILAAKFNVLWGYYYQSPYKTLIYNLDIILAIGWRF